MQENHYYYYYIIINNNNNIIIIFTLFYHNNFLKYVNNWFMNQFNTSTIILDLLRFNMAFLTVSIYN